LHFRSDQVDLFFFADGLFPDRKPVRATISPLTRFSSSPRHPTCLSPPPRPSSGVSALVSAATIFIVSSFCNSVQLFLCLTEQRPGARIWLIPVFLRKYSIQLSKATERGRLSHPSRDSLFANSARPPLIASFPSPPL